MADPASTGADDDDILLASFLESEILSAGLDQVIVSFFLFQFQDLLVSEYYVRFRASLMVVMWPQEDTSKVRPAKRLRSDEGSQTEASQIGTGTFGNIPPELFNHIFKFLSSEV